MWLEKLKELSNGNLKGPLKYLNLNFELHNALYLIETLDGVYDFKLEGTEKMQIVSKADGERITEDKFLYWWQIERYSQLVQEEQKLISSFEDVKKKVNKLQRGLPKNEEDDSEKDKEKKQKKIEDINVKLSKLISWLNKEGPILKQNLQILSNYRNTYSSEKSLKEILKWVNFYLMNR